MYRKNIFISVSESTKQDLINLGINEERIEVVYNAVNEDMFLNRFPKKENSLITYIGRLKRYKRVDLLIESFGKLSEEFPHLKLVIIGEGDHKDNLIKYTMKKGLLDKVIFTGFISGEEKRSILSKSLFTVNPSTKEGWGLTVIESNATYTPVIASDSPGLRDAVRDRETGLLFKQGDAEDLYKKMKLLLTDEKLRKKLSINARKWADNFSWDESARKILSLMEKVIGEK